MTKFYLPGGKDKTKKIKKQAPKDYKAIIRANVTNFIKSQITIETQKIIKKIKAN